MLGRQASIMEAMPSKQQHVQMEEGGSRLPAGELMTTGMAWVHCVVTGGMACGVWCGKRGMASVYRGQAHVKLAHLAAACASAAAEAESQPTTHVA